MKAALFRIIQFLILFIFLSLWGFYWAIRPIRITSSITPKNFDVTYQEISFQTKDHVLIRGWFIPSAKPKAKTVILLHGYPADKGNILPSMIFLHHNFNLLLFDFRYFGKSNGHYSTVGKNEVFDLLAAIKYLQTRGISEVGVWGFSLGGSVALMTAQEAPEIKAIISESAYARLDWLAYDLYPIPLLRYPLGELTRLWAWLFLGYDIKKISPANSVTNLKIPILLIHSRHDTVIPFSHALLLKDALNHNQNTQILFFDKEKHGEIIPNHQKIVNDFFEKNL